MFVDTKIKLNPEDSEEHNYLELLSEVEDELPTVVRNVYVRKGESVPFKITEVPVDDLLIMMHAVSNHDLLDMESIEGLKTILNRALMRSTIIEMQIEMEEGCAGCPECEGLDDQDDSEDLSFDLVRPPTSKLKH